MKFHTSLPALADTVSYPSICASLGEYTPATQLVTYRMKPIHQGDASVNKKSFFQKEV